MKPQGTHYLPLSLRITWIRYWKKKHYSIIHLMPFLHPSHCQTFFPFLFSHNFIFCSLSVSPEPALSRRESSISRMKALSLFGCVRKVMTAAHHLPTLPCRLLIFSSLTAHHGVIIPCFFFSFLSEQNSSQSFIPCLKKYEANRGSRESCEDSESRISWESVWNFNLNISLYFTTEPHQSFYVTCDFTAEKNATPYLESCRLPK